MVTTGQDAVSKGVRSITGIGFLFFIGYYGFFVCFDVQLTGSAAQNYVLNCVLFAHEFKKTIICIYV